MLREVTVGFVFLSVAVLVAVLFTDSRASHVALPMMAVDTNPSGNSYTANPSYPADTNNQDNRIVSASVEPCSLVPMPAVNIVRTVEVLLKNSPETIATDIRLYLGTLTARSSTHLSQKSHR